MSKLLRIDCVAVGVGGEVVGWGAWILEMEEIVIQI